MPAPVLTKSIRDTSFPLVFKCLFELLNISKQLNHKHTTVIFTQDIAFFNILSNSYQMGSTWAKAARGEPSVFPVTLNQRLQNANEQDPHA